ncbi:hypothetical protein MGSAQ_002129 [marine sediment metagenome]|uniref:Uncharacterized protein n=1 Tax=marine sediment metagenome TaxID=412755 RepID=A0A1B6NSB9_9ZZZZ
MTTNCLFSSMMISPSTCVPFNEAGKRSNPVTKKASL